MYLSITIKGVSNLNERWKLGMTLNPKLRTYIKFEEQVQFRMRVLHLSIETCRFKSIPVEERVCVI